MPTEPNIAALRSEIDWLMDKNPFRAARLSEAVALLEQAGECKRKAVELLQTTATAGSAVGRAHDEL